MKKLLLILLCVPLMFSCGENKEEKEEIKNDIVTNNSCNLATPTFFSYILPVIF